MTMMIKKPAVAPTTTGNRNKFPTGNLRGEIAKAVPSRKANYLKTLNSVQDTPRSYSPEIEKARECAAAKWRLAQRAAQEIAKCGFSRQALGELTARCFGYSRPTLQGIILQGAMKTLGRLP